MSRIVQEQKGTVVVWNVTRAALLVSALMIVQWLYFAAVVAWESRRTHGLRYFGLPPGAREHFRRLLRFHRVLLSPLIWFLSRWHGFTFSSASVRLEAMTAPQGTCSTSSLQAAATYRPSESDIFVVAQMKSGTTWTQQVVCQLLTRGADELVAHGRTLGSMSAWLESERGVPVDEAPVVGTQRPSRLIKTHLPADVCPYSPHAKYIYVVRHPASCFASCRDFLNANLQSFAPPLADVERWFCSSEMWWGAWPEHVAGWWQRARQCDNVLWVRFEDMKLDLPSVIERLAAFLNLRRLAPDELERVLRHCQFEWMREHAELFEPQPPHLLQSAPRLFVKGSLHRYEDVSESLRARVVAWCRDGLERRGLPWHLLYPEPELSAAGCALVSRRTAVDGPPNLEKDSLDARTDEVCP